MDSSYTETKLEGVNKNSIKASHKLLGDFIEAAGLMEYDPKQITKIYRGHPLRLLKRLWQTLIPICLYLLGIGTDFLFGLLNNEERAKSRAKEFTDLLVKLGPAFIKGGQALSTRPDLIPPLVLDELAQLQDQLPGFEGELAMACIKQDLGKEWHEIFIKLDSEPISAASLGQVHKGVLKNGDTVAVKIQRPGLREQITIDLYIVRNIAKWFKNNIGLIRSDLVGLIDELGKRIFEEMDYLNEAANAEKFMYLHKHNTRIAIPKIYKHATSRRVLTMEWIDGVKLTNLEAVKQLGIDPEEMIEVGVNCSLQQLLEHGFFHADPHPGNLLALKDGRLCYLDFGMMSEVSRESRTGLIQAVVHLVNRSFGKLSKDFVALGFLSEDVNLEPIAPAFEKVFTKALQSGVNKMDFKSVTDDLSNVMYKLPFQVPPYYALIIRSLITLEGIALSVDPNFKILGAAYPYFAKRLMEDPDPELRQSLKEMIFEGDILQWQKVEDLMTSAVSQTEVNIEDLLNQVFNFLFSVNGSYLRKQITEKTATKLDEINWYVLEKIRAKVISKKRREDSQFKSTRQFILMLKKLKILNLTLLIKTLIRLIFEPNAIRMGASVIKVFTEKSMVRLVRLAANAS